MEEIKQTGTYKDLKQYYKKVKLCKCGKYYGVDGIRERNKGVCPDCEAIGSKRGKGK